MHLAGGGAANPPPACFGGKMSTSLEFKVDLKGYRKQMKVVGQRQMPFAIATGLNNLAVMAKADVDKAMAADFDRPTPFTLNAFYVKKANKRDLTAWLGARDFASKGTPAAKYLAPQVFGGDRRLKRFERRLSVIAGGRYIVPGHGAQLDQYGNISRGQIGKILSRLGVMTDMQQNASEATKRRLAKQGLAHRQTATDYFLAREKGTGRPLGVYQLQGRGRVVPVLVFTDHPPSYTTRFPFESVVTKSLQGNAKQAMADAIAHTLATARR